MTLTDDIKLKALQSGFDLVGVTDASAIAAEQAEFFSRWLQAGCAGQMTYLYHNLEKRTDPSKLLPNAQSIIVVALNFKPKENLYRIKGTDAKQSCSASDKIPAGRIAAYARYEDYHPFIKNRLRKLSDFITSIAGKDLRFKICVDSAPVSERALAVRAGFGFIGKNRMLIHPQLGPQLFLGEIMTTLKLQPDESYVCQRERNKTESRNTLKKSNSSILTSSNNQSPLFTAPSCSTCNKCSAVCPTGALQADGRFDATKCINYLTIEYRGQISSDLSQKIGDRLFGCDDCVLACPYRQSAPPCQNKHFRFYPDRANLNLRDLLTLKEQSFKTKFADSVIKYPGLEILKRNAQICFRNIKNTNSIY